MYAATDASSSQSVEAYKASMSRESNSHSEGTNGAAVHTPRVDAKASLGTRLAMLQEGLWQASSRAAAAGLFLAPLLVTLHMLACVVPVSAAPTDGALVSSWGDHRSKAYAGAELIGTAPGQCLSLWHHWLVLGVCVLLFMCSFIAAVLQRLHFPEGPGQSGSILGATIQPSQAVLHDAWDCCTAALCIVGPVVLPLGVVVLLLLVGQAAMLVHWMLRVATPHLWQWYTVAAWHALRLGLCLSALVVVLAGGAPFNSLSGVLLMTACISCLSSSLAPLWLYWLTVQTARCPQYTISSPRSQMLWLSWRIQRLHAPSVGGRLAQLHRRSSSSRLAGGAGEQEELAQGLQYLHRLANKPSTGPSVAVESLMYACSVHRALRVKSGGSTIPELLALQHLLHLSQRAEVQAYVSSRVHMIQEQLLAQQLTSNDTARSTLLSSAMQHVAVCLGAQAVVWQSLSRAQHEVQIDALHEAAAELYAARLEVEGIMEFMSARSHLISADLLHVKAFYLQHILQLPDAAAQVQKGAIDLERRAAFSTKHGAADGGDDEVDISLGLHELRLFEEPPKRALSTGFRASALLRGMFQGAHAQKVDNRDNAMAANLFEYGLLLLSLPSHNAAAGTILQVNAFGAYLLGLQSADTAVGCSVMECMLPCVAQSFTQALHDALGSQQATWGDWLDRPLLIPLQLPDGTVAFVYASASLAPPILSRDSRNGQLDLQCALLVRLLPVTVLNSARASALLCSPRSNTAWDYTDVASQVAWLPSHLRDVAGVTIGQAMQRASRPRVRKRQGLWATSLAPTNAPGRTSHAAPTYGTQWTPATDSRVCALAVQLPQARLGAHLDVLLVGLGQQAAAGGGGGGLASLLQAFHDDDGTKSGTGHDTGSVGGAASDASDSGSSGELQDTFGAQAESEAMTATEAPPGLHPAQQLAAPSERGASPAKKGAGVPHASVSSSAILRLALSTFTLSAFSLNVAFKRALAVGIVMTSVLFVYNLMPDVIRPETLRFSFQAGLRSSLLLSSSVLPASAARVRGLRSAPWLWTGLACSSSAATVDHMFVSNCSFAPPRAVATQLALQDAQVATHVLRELQRLDAIIFAAVDATESPRLTQPHLYSVPWPSRLTENTTDSAEGVWSKHTARYALQAGCWQSSSALCAAPFTTPAALSGVRSSMQAAELVLRRHAAENVQAAYVTSTLINLASGVVMGIVVAIGTFSFGWKVKLMRRWVFRSLRGIPSSTALQLYLGVTQLYDSMVYSVGAGGGGGGSDDEATHDALETQQLLSSRKGGSQGTPQTGPLRTPLTGPLGLDADRRTVRSGSGGNPELLPPGLFVDPSAGGQGVGGFGSLHGSAGSPGERRGGGTAFSRSMRLSGGGLSPMRNGAASTVSRRMGRPPRALSGSMRLDSGSVLGSRAGFGGSVLGSPAARSAMGMGGGMMSKRLGSQVGTPVSSVLSGGLPNAQGRGGHPGSVLSNTHKSVASRQSSQLSSAILGMGALNMAAFRSSADTSTLQLGAAGAQQAQLLGAAASGQAAHGSRAHTSRTVNESWRYFCVVLSFMGIMLALVVVNIAIFVGVSAWHRANIINSEARVFLLHDSAAQLTSVSSSLMGALDLPASDSGLYMPPADAAAAILHAVEATRDSFRLLALGGDIQYLEHATLAGASNDTKPVPLDAPLGRLLYQDACTEEALGFDAAAASVTSPLVLSAEIPASLSATVLNSAPGHAWHRAQCVLVENGVFTQGLQAAVALHASLARAAADQLLASAANASYACPTHVLASAHDAVLLANRSDVSAAQAAGCARLVALAARATRLELLHLSAVLRRAAAMDFVHGMDAHLQWNVLIMWYSMMLPLVNGWVILGVALPMFQSLLQGIVADQLLLTVLPQALRDAVPVKQRIEPVLRHILRTNQV